MLLTITTLLLIVAIVAIWANRQLLNPDNWSSTSTSLLQNETIRTATANYLVDQLYANVDVSARSSQRLPPRLQPLAGPIAGALRNAAVQGTELALSRPVIQNAWATANRAARSRLWWRSSTAATPRRGQRRRGDAEPRRDPQRRRVAAGDLRRSRRQAAAVSGQPGDHQANQLKLIQDIGRG